MAQPRKREIESRPRRRRAVPSPAGKTSNARRALALLPGPPADADRAERRAIRTRDALLLRISGVAYDEIAEAVGISIDYARELVRDGLSADIQITGDELRRLEHFRCEALLERYWPLAIGIDEAGQRAEPNFHAFDAVLKIMARIDRLYGLEARERHEVDEGVRMVGMLQLGGSHADYIAAVKKLVEPQEGRSTRRSKRCPLPG